MQTRTETRTRTVPKTIDGKTHQVQETYTVELPVPPPDRKAQVKQAVTAFAALIVLAAVVWSALAIGGLLSMAFTPWAAYMIAAVFDGAWVCCLALEWVHQYNPQRARAPRRAGWAALVLSMGLIAAHGAVEFSLWVGIAGAAVSLLAKGLWHIVMTTNGARLDSATQQWADAERAEAEGRLATVDIRRELQRQEARIREESAALEGSGSVSALEWRTPATDGLTEDRLRAEVEDTAERIRIAQSGEQVAQRLTSAEPEPLSPAEPRLSRPEPAQAEQAQPREPFGFSAASVQRQERTERVAELLKAEPGLTGAQVAERLGVSLASGKRYLADARKEVQK
ncbi:protein transporter Sec31 [Streptomyces cyaneochromogenes]|uniref:Protein transporter Sec31 n=1 Tax=Streptomyces cyaneochromogenes TaxID=2496836 RepID=A0A3S9M0B2_9ACTN|nr:protein transporter Sec31 [Streptomyces cyaneochromogenes]AZQ32638.1 protein transporter Sec31 [Streptomyces cyaneochromogenes]